MSKEELDLTNAHKPDLSDVEIQPSLTVRTAAECRHRAVCVHGNPFTCPKTQRCYFYSSGQAIDLTANRLTSLDPRLLELQGGTLLPLTHSNTRCYFGCKG